MEKKMYDMPVAEMLMVEAKDVIAISGIELPDDEL